MMHSTIFRKKSLMKKKDVARAVPEKWGKYVPNSTALRTGDRLVKRTHLGAEIGPAW